jgi:hypothetical protein
MPSLSAVDYFQGVHFAPQLVDYMQIPMGANSLRALLTLYQLVL